MTETPGRYDIESDADDMIAFTDPPATDWANSQRDTGDENRAIPGDFSATFDATNSGPWVARLRPAPPTELVPAAEFDHVLGLCLRLEAERAALGAEVAALGAALAPFAALPVSVAMPDGRIYVPWTGLTAGHIRAAHAALGK